MKEVMCKEGCGTKLDRKIDRAICNNCRRKLRSRRAQIQKEALEKFRRCDVCHKKPKCSPDAHGRLTRFLVYTRGGIELTEAGKNKFGADYLEKLRCQNSLSNVPIVTNTVNYQPKSAMPSAPPAGENFTLLAEK